MKWILKLICICLGCLFITFVSAQEERNKKRNTNSARSSVSKLSEKLRKDVPDEVIADDYVELASTLFADQEYVKAEDYFERAIKIYTKQKLNEKASGTYRQLAKVRELLSKTTDAIQNYSQAAQLTSNSTLKELNENDASRLANPSDLKKQSVYIQKNLDLAATPEVRKEKVAAYQQMAQVKLEMNDNAGAIEELESALNELSSQSESESESFQVKQHLANTLAADKRFVDAIQLNQELIADAKEAKNTNQEISQMRNLSNVYFDADIPAKGYDALKEAYALAVQEGQTLAAKNVMQQLVSHYQKERNWTQAMELYADFIGRLDTLVKNDSTLVDAQFFQLHEEKISQLEKERELKDELIERKNKYNYVLTASIVFILLILVALIRILISNIRKNKKIALQSLRREMNPHFIFNSLNSVNQFIAQNNELEANKYLTSYSRLMRNVMENSNKDFISLSTELEQLKEYLELEHQRFRDKFDYRIELDESLDVERILVPNMLIQPQLENAIWHGLRYKQDGKGVLGLTICQKHGNIEITVEDNGIGREKSQVLKTEHQKARQSRGITNTRERIDLLSRLYHLKITMQIKDKTGNENGVVVVFQFPLWIKK